MLFSEEEHVFMNERDGSVTVSTKSRKVILKDGSSHMLPVINRLSFPYLNERKKRKHAVNCEASTSTANSNAANYRRIQYIMQGRI